MTEYLNFKNPNAERLIHQQRLLISVVGIITFALILLARLFYLQVIQHELYTTQSDKNRVQLEAIGPTRGLIYDRNGQLLADNQPNYSIRLVPERITDIEKTLTDISALILISDEHIKRFKKRRKRRRYPFEAVPLKFNLSEKEISVIAVNRHILPGVEVAAGLIRHYPHDNILAHALGYVARINEKELTKLDPEIGRAHV